MGWTANPHCCAVIHTASTADPPRAKSVKVPPVTEMTAMAELANTRWRVSSPNAVPAFHCAR